MQVAEVTPMLPAASLPVPASLAHCGGRCAELVGSAQPGSRYRRQQTEEGARSTCALAAVPQILLPNICLRFCAFF